MLLLFICSQVLCDFEENIHTAISEDLQVKSVNYVMKGVSFVSQPAFNIVPPVGFYVYEKKDIAKHGFVGFIGNCATVFPLKLLVNRQRPSGTSDGWDSSFPSGHTTFAFTQAVVYSHHYPKMRLPFYLYAALVGFARIYVGEHYPTDVIGGAALGLLTGYLTIKLLE